MPGQPSTQSLEDLPEIDELIRLSKAIAMLDAILSPDWEYRRYSFNSKWSADQLMASMRNGSGDEYFILFSQHGAAMKGFSHEKEMASNGELWPGMYDGLPDEFNSFLNEAAFSMDDATFCIWRKSGDSEWHCGVTDFPDDFDPDGSEEMLAILGGDPETYQTFASENYEVEIPLTAIEHIYQLRPLTEEIIAELNPDQTLESVDADVVEIGYPTGTK